MKEQRILTSWGLLSMRKVQFFASGIFKELGVRENTALSQRQCYFSKRISPETLWLNEMKSYYALICTNIRAQ